ncbi:hypothetical protein PG913_04895 [Tenacibaculum pacificus]|uniref:polysialyltransferase family glycosyltransferase n=1 Tax=Tenacibaculum pacificus TaxID=3018314 RepID=UPI0022F3C6D0|nr:polysialyltransferase family glycosyltransferase [Tenacibaculum pacificus]WBX74529.1 hypothetical protein PG913_04895 [Tenacibaculum pacificus]
MNNTYVASTVYHIYLIILHIIKEENDELTKQNNLLILTENTKGIKSLIPFFEDSLFFRKVVFLPNNRIQKKMLSKVSYTFNRKKIIPVLENKYRSLKDEEVFIENSTIFIGDSDSAKNYFYFKYKHKGFIMFEDGAGTYVNIPSKLNVFKKKILKNGFTFNGHGDEIKHVIAVKPEKLPKLLYNKSQELNINSISKALSLKLKMEIFKTFNFNFDKLNSEKPKVLILGSTISEDNLVAKESIKINIFKDLLNEIDYNIYDVYFKPHPREKTIYNFKNVVLIPKLFPSELLTLDSDIFFEKGYAIISTSLDNLGETVKEKIYVFDRYKHHFTKFKKESENIIKKYN